MRKKHYDKDFEFVLNTKQKSHLINKSNDLSVSGAEYVRLLIEQDIITEELKSTKNKTVELNEQLFIVQERLKRRHKD